MSCPCLSLFSLTTTHSLLPSDNRLLCRDGGASIRATGEDGGSGWPRSCQPSQVCILGTSHASHLSLIIPFTRQRLKWVDEGYELLVFTDECIISNGQMTIKLQRELLNADIFVIVAVTNKESVEWINNNCKTIENVICLDSSPDLKNKLGGYDVPSEVRGSIFGNFFGKSQSDKAKESYEVVQTVSEAWDRHNSDDIRFCLLVLINAYIRPVPVLKNLGAKEDLFVGWLESFKGSWRVVAGQNPAYDQFPCQYQFFYRGKAKGSFWYEPVFQVKTLEGQLVWSRRKYRVRRGKVPGTFYFSVLDNGVVSNEFWTIVDVSDNLSWGLFYYHGAARVAGQSYTGAVLVSPDGAFPNDTERTKIVAALDKCEIKEWEVYSVDNCSCIDPPLGSLHTIVQIADPKYMPI
ncbi:hypothetical protein JHK82_021359 [Glycine max]|nr:hypothetical protein JHK82_021359 [Glycine max]